MTSREKDIEMVKANEYHYRDTKLHRFVKSFFLKWNHKLIKDKPRGKTTLKPCHHKCLKVVMLSSQKLYIYFGKAESFTFLNFHWLLSETSLVYGKKETRCLTNKQTKDTCTCSEWKQSERTSYNACDENCWNRTRAFLVKLNEELVAIISPAIGARSSNY